MKTVSLLPHQQRALRLLEDYTLLLRLSRTSPRLVIPADFGKTITYPRYDEILDWIGG